MNRYIRILLLGSYVWYLGEGLLGPLYAVFAQRIGGDILDISGAYAVYLIATGIVSIVVGRVSDRFSRRHIMVAGYALNAVATFGYLLVREPGTLFLIQALLGVASAMATPTWDSLFSQHLDTGRSGREWGLSDGGPHILTGIALLAGGLIITRYSFTTLFVIMGMIQTVAVVVQSSILRFKPTPATNLH